MTTLYLRKSIGRSRLLNTVKPLLALLFSVCTAAAIPVDLGPAGRYAMPRTYDLPLFDGAPPHDLSFNLFFSDSVTARSAEAESFYLSVLFVTDGSGFIGFPTVGGFALDANRDPLAPDAVFPISGYPSDGSVGSIIGVSLLFSPRFTCYGAHFDLSLPSDVTITSGSFNLNAVRRGAPAPFFIGTVPDGGSTLALLCLSALALGAWGDRVRPRTGAPKAKWHARYCAP
jgi:hypothetical protein